ncbi:hypothetical protein VKT23_003093 [Stygiomarasmius scandens]|uniref:Uncharacterized protein n=1 Tax=Marasmiellus scandens TaxID=2682957 RepID=A0ABR1K1V5_9AGAR
MRCFIFPILFGAFFASVQNVLAAPVARAGGGLLTALKPTNDTQNLVDAVASANNAAPSSTATNGEDIFAFTSWEPKDENAPETEGENGPSKRIFAADAWEPSQSESNSKRNDLIFAVIGWEPEEPESSTTFSAVETSTVTADN